MICKLCAVLVMFCLVQTLLAKEEVLSRRERRARKGKGPGCGNWVFGECKPLEGSCGAGQQLATREGNCRVKERTYECEVPCDVILHGEDPAIDRMNVEDDNDDDDKEMISDRPGRRRGRKGKKAKCRYIKEAGECDEATNQMTLTMTLKKGDPNQCEATKVVQRPCKKRGGRGGRKNKGRGGKKKGRGCRYDRPAKDELPECDAETNTRNFTLTLKKGDPALCPSTKNVSRQCRERRSSDRCRYTRSDWSPCDESTNTMTRTLNLKRGPAVCVAAKTVTKKCKGTGPQSSERCRYNQPTVSACVDGQKTVTKTLKSGGANCENPKTTTKSCKQGRGKCEFGPWGDFGTCSNGVKTKTRQLVSGNADKCQRRTVKTKNC